MDGHAIVRSFPCSARPGRLSALRVSHSKSVLYGAFAWVRRALSRPKTAVSGPRAAACLVHYLLLKKFTRPRFTILNRFWPGQSFNPPRLASTRLVKVRGAPQCGWFFPPVRPAQCQRAGRRAVRLDVLGPLLASLD